MAKTPRTEKPSEDHKFTFRLPPDLHDELVTAAKARRISINSALLFAVEDWLAQDELAQRRKARDREDVIA